ncbi:tRNA threonylcarbamoyladenosine biosynthesis protein TsaB [Devosia enhydra]|uniref:N(6)-L-threonylcarbamoyladenine synthase n=1 Tax=Devosia enhydra TaxID=665118 RepID=A0A1K2HY92_9HYPH|nr:tRNA (adenosine(37)-N6)-threonylcarbamoyltransferase complex dimerization subunit type 1 TsaB [Devosia enhydra]SFZ84883.1 tRNA threonylcarbamoyladenosine biosynthesis protein TsaB [Devosia enhydra]
MSVTLPPLTLAIDTSGPRLQLAVYGATTAGTAIADALVEDLAKGHAERILPAVADLLASNGLALRDLGRIGVTSGPGSFTGLRIGLSAARGLGLGLGVPVLGIPTLIAMSLSGPEAGPFTVLIDARRDEAYRQRFSAPGVAADGPALLPMTDARALVGPHEPVRETPFCDISALARFVADADPVAFPPEPLYLRGADAKPQEKARIARLPGSAAVS